MNLKTMFLWLVICIKNTIKSKNYKNIQWRIPENVQWREPENVQWREPENVQWREPENVQWREPEKSGIVNFEIKCWKLFVFKIHSFLFVYSWVYYLFV